LQIGALAVQDFGMASPTSPSYLRQLDGLRALSVAAVAWSHWRAYWFHQGIVPWAELGVETFFVISGFLITGILLDNRCEKSGLLVLKQFYIRRSLRIFPVFYATLLVAWLWRADGMESWGWHAGYLSNVYFYLWGWHGQLSHFWSLAVEEQFYLCWPLLMVFLPNRWLLPAIVTSIVLAPVFEMAIGSFHLAPPAGVSAAVLMPSCMDALGIGALLALGVRKNYPMKQLATVLLVVGVAGYFLCRCFGGPEPIGRMSEECVLGWLVFSAAKGFHGPFGRLLGSAPLCYLGKISYGLYVFHNFAAAMWGRLISILGSPLWLVKLYNIPVIRILAFAGLTIGLAAYSWHRFEKPINDLKRKFPYPAQKLSSASGPKTDVLDLRPAV
jgi:peptidoglycan/LPS O-acetylase OafA/YrhL